MLRCSTASMVTFINAEPNKDLYRRFRIYQKKGGDDYASLKEVSKRRLRHLGDWGTPDLIIVDGGKGQVKTFFDNFSSKSIPTIGLAKRLETIFVPTPKGIKKFWEKRPGECPALYLIQRLRDESHRFARLYHHKLIEKALISSA
jgi:excinuclease ABC subunit C